MSTSTYRPTSVHRTGIPACCLLALILGGCQKATESAPPAAAAPAAPVETVNPPTDLEQLAERVVTQSLGIKEGELVMITGGSQDQELLENLAVQVRKQGGFPLLSVSSSRLVKRDYFDVPAKFDSQPDKLGMTIVRNFDAIISVSSNLEESPLAGADPARLVARAETSKPVSEMFFKRKIRQAELGNDLYPTAWRARRLGLEQQALSKLFWEGVNVDYASLAARASEVTAVIAKGREVHITDGNGTDLKVSIAGRPVYSSDGIVSAAEAAKGGAAAQAYLPAGEVYVTPVAGTAEGKVVFPKYHFEGKDIEGLSMTFVKGKLVALEGGGPGFAPLKALYDAAGAGKELLGAIDLGINPSVRLPEDSSIGTWIPAGSITLGIGSNEWAGGSNQSSYGLYISLPRSSLTLDGKPIVTQGKLEI